MILRARKKIMTTMERKCRKLNNDAESLYGHIAGVSLALVVLS
jgi:hypothetical protein